MSNIAITCLAVRKWRGDVWVARDLPARGFERERPLALTQVGMAVALLVAARQQYFVACAGVGSCRHAHFAAQLCSRFIRAMSWRNLFGCVFAVGVVVLVRNLSTIGRGERRAALVVVRCA